MDGKQLKNSILQWAIQGKLVEQNPKDEPAQKLLEKIALSRHSERSEESSKRSKKTSKNPTSRIYRENGVWYEQVGTATPKDISDEIPFEIPENWAWCRFFQVVHIASNLVDSSKYLSFKHIAPDNIEKGSGKLFACKTVAEDKVISNNHLFKKGQIIYSKIRPLLRKCVIAPFEGLCSADMYPLESSIDNSYVMQILLSDMFNKQVAEICASRVKMPKINQEELSRILMPLPPLAEQKRIVAKLEQVLPLAEEYGTAQEQLDKLNKELPEALKKSILQEAFQGKLVPQNPKDEPAQKLLEKIALSRHSERSEESSKRSKKTSKDQSSRIYRENGVWYEQIGTATPKDITDEIPFEIPETWAWCRMGNFITIATGLAYKKEDLDVRAKSYIRVLRGGNIDYGKWSLKEDDVFIAPQFVKDDLILKKGTFITPAVTSLEQMGKTALIESDQKDLVVGGFVLMLSSVYNDEIFLKYILNFFQSYYYKQYCQSITNKSGQAFYNLSRQKLLQCLIPLPPLAEQKRIVAKLEQLFKVL
jgi:type I restriction enzyme S subunit